MEIPTKALILLLAVAIPSAYSTSATSSSYYHEALPDTSNDRFNRHSMPPNPKPYSILYDDGTKSPMIQLKVRGKDPSPYIYEETVEGRFTVKPPSKKGQKYQYLDLDKETGELVETGLIVGVDDPVMAHVNQNAAERSISIRVRRGKKKYEPSNNRNLRDLKGDAENVLHPELHEAQLPPEHARRTAITSGTLKNLVIPFRFADHTGRTLPSRSDLNVLMNNNGPNALCPTGSVRDVYLENSFNQLDLQSTVVDWVTIDFTEAQCAAGQSALTSSFHSCLTNALDKAVAAGVNFGDFDLDNNGLIDGITFFHSGYAAEFGGIDSSGTSRANRIWSHKWAIFATNWSNNGVRVFEYHINPSLWSTSGSSIGRIGVVAHETGHFLGLPDL